MNRAWIALIALSLLAMVAACGSEEVAPPEDSAMIEEGTEDDTGVPYPPQEDSVGEPAAPEFEDFEGEPTLLDEEPLTISPEDQRAVEEMERELAASDSVLGTEEGLWPSDEELLEALDEEEQYNEGGRGGGDATALAIVPGEESYPKVESLQAAYFEFDRHDLTPEAREALDRNVAWMRANPEVRVRVEGHCDERGSSEYNLALGQRRANRVVDYFISEGIDSDRLHGVSFGEEVPVMFGHDEGSWRQNRRVEFSYLDGEPSDSVGRVLSRSTVR